jgi:hypothetical protein
LRREESFADDTIILSLRVPVEQIRRFVDWHVLRALPC